MVDEKGNNLGAVACPTAHLLENNCASSPWLFKVMVNEKGYNLGGGACPSAYLLGKKIK